MSAKSKFEIAGRDVRLSEMLATLREELLFAKNEGEDSGIQFQMDRVDVELKIALTRRSKGRAGVEFWVVTAGGESGLEQSATHTFRLTMTPISRDGPVILASRRSGTVSEK